MLQLVVQYVQEPLGFKRLRLVRKTAKSDYRLRHVCVCLSVRMEQLISHWTDLHKILYFGIFRKPAEEIQVLLKSDNYNGYFT